MKPDQTPAVQSRLVLTRTEPLLPNLRSCDMCPVPGAGYILHSSLQRSEEVTDVTRSYSLQVLSFSSHRLDCLYQHTWTIAPVGSRAAWCTPAKTGSLENNWKVGRVSVYPKAKPNSKKDHRLGPPRPCSGTNHPREIPGMPTVGGRNTCCSLAQHTPNPFSPGHP